MTAKRILIYLHETHASWVIANAARQSQQIVLKGNLADLAPLVTDHAVHMIVPGEAVLLTTVKLPKLNAQRIKQALPFALEEQLIEDVNNLHFVIGDYQPDHGFPVAVVAKEKMDAWLALFKQANITPTAFIPATLALPVSTDNGYICMMDELAIVRTGQYAGFTCDKENMAKLLELNLAEAKEKISCIHLYHFSSTPPAFKLNTITVNEVMLNENQLLEHFMQWTATYPTMNLLQDTYQTSTKKLGTKKIWITAGCLALAWISFSLLSNVGSFFILNHATSVSEQAIEKIYKKNFPHASMVVAPRQRMEEKLKTLSTTTNQNLFLSMLGIIGNHLPHAKGIRLLSLDYRGHQLTLSVTAATFENLDTFTQQLTQQHLNVKQQNASIIGATVKANLLITQGVL